MHEKSRATATNRMLLGVFKLFSEKKKIRISDTPLSLAIEISGAYENIAVKTVHAKNKRNGVNSEVLINFGRGDTKYLEIQKIMPKSHAVWVAAIE